MRNLAEQSVEQAKKAFDDFITAAQKAVTAVEGQTAGAKASTKNIGEKAMAFAEKNVATSFEFAQKVVRAKDIQELTQLQTEFVKTQMPTFVAARTLTDRFHIMVKQRTEADLVPWIAAASQSLIASFASGITKDIAAVHAALVKPWSNGQTEGQITKLKLVKRQMYGS